MPDLNVQRLKRYSPPKLMIFVEPNDCDDLAAVPADLATSISVNDPPTDQWASRYFKPIAVLLPCFTEPT